MIRAAETQFHPISLNFTATRDPRLARLEDLHRQTPAKIEASVHVTAGKYDKRPLEEALLASPKYSAMLARVRATMGYG